MYFQGGSWMGDLARASTGFGRSMQTDSIAIGTVTNVAQISSIIYDTYRSPVGTDGLMVLAGAAPD